MLNIDAKIEPGISVGGVKIGTSIEEFITSLNHSKTLYTLKTFSNFGMHFLEITVESYGLRIVGKKDDVIELVSCRKPYRGQFKDRYYLGMTVAELKAVADKLLVIHGYIVLDGEFGVAFDFPEFFEGVPYDDLENIEELPDHMPLNEMVIRNKEWWR